MELEISVYESNYDKCFVVIRIDDWILKEYKKGSGN